MSTTVDSSGHSHLAHCTSCGWRGTITLTRSDAEHQARNHERDTGACGAAGRDRERKARSRAQR